MLNNVLVCSPHDLRYGHTLTALDRDLHILLKKIITLNPDEYRALVALAAEKNLALVVAQNPPDWSHDLYLCDRISQGEIEGAAIH